MLSPREPSTSASVGEHTLPLASCALGAAQPGHHRHQLRSHRPRSAVDTCRRPGLFRRPPSDSHRNRSNHDRLDPREANTHSVHNYLSLAISNLPIALAVGYHRRLAHRVSPYPSAHHHQCYCAGCAVRYHQVVWFAHDDYRCRTAGKYLKAFRQPHGAGRRKARRLFVS